MSNTKQTPYLLFSGSDLRVILQEHPGVEATLDEPKPEFLRDEKRGMVHYSICGDLTATQALAFAANITKAARLAEDWEAGDETRETILRKYGKASKPEEGTQDEAKQG